MVAVAHYRQQIINLNHVLITKRQECVQRFGKVILVHDVSPHTSKLVKEILKLN